MLSLLNISTIELSSEISTLSPTTQLYLLLVFFKIPLNLHSKTSLLLST